MSARQAPTAAGRSLANLAAKHRDGFARVLVERAQELDFAGDRREFGHQVVAALNRAIGPIGVGVNAKGGAA